MLGWSSHRCTARRLQVVRCCRVQVLIAGLQCRDCRPHKRASRNLQRFTQVCGSQPKEAVTSAGPRVQPGTQFPRPHIFLQTSRRHRVGTCHFFFILFLFLFLHPPSWLHPVYGSLYTAPQPPAACVTGHHVLLEHPKTVQNRHGRASSLLTLTVQQHFPCKPRMEMAERESGRL